MRQSIILCTVVFLMALALAACGASTQGPTSWLDRPLDGDKVPLEPLTIQAHASDADGVARFEFLVGDTLLAQVPGGGSRFADAQAGWSPSAAGTYTVRARAVDGQGNVGPEAVSLITVGEVTQTPTPMPTAAQPLTPTYTPSPAPAEPGGGISEAQITFTADRYSLKQGECTMLRWSVQGGYSVELDGERVERQGQSRVCPQQTTTYRLGADEGEAFEWSTIVIAVSAEQPPTPTYTPTPTGTPRPPTPTYTPTPTGTPKPPPPPPPPPADIQFWADSDNIPAGSCTTVHWHVANVKAYWVNGQPGAGDNGSFQTCPCQEEKHTLHVVKADNSEQDFYVTIHVYGECAAPPPPPLPPPPPPPPQDTEGPSFIGIGVTKEGCKFYGRAAISDPSGVAWAQFYYQLGGGGWQNVGMNEESYGYFKTGDISVGIGVVSIEYYVLASDHPGNPSESAHATDTVGCIE